MVQPRTRKLEKPAENVLDLVHCDAAGPSEPITKEGKYMFCYLLMTYLVCVCFKKYAIIANVLHYRAIITLSDGTMCNTAAMWLDQSDNGYEINCRLNA